MAPTLFDPRTRKLLLGISVLYIAMFTFGPVDSLDIRFFYTGEFAQIFFIGLSPALQESYVRQCLLDLIFIHFYGSLIWHQFSLLKADRNLRLVALAPAAFDIIETATIFWILVSSQIPEHLDWLGFVTAAKWTTIVLLFWLWFLFFFKSRRHAHRSL